jgi:SAM-dependent methyltransferase
MVAASPILEATREALADEWNAAAPTTPEEIAAFYRHSERLGDDLDAWHDLEERQAWTKAIVQVAGANKAKRILDVGAGGGHDLEALRGAFPDSELVAVEPNIKAYLHLYHVTRLRGQRAGAVYEDIKEVEGTFDLTVCIDVLEHVPDPDALLAQIIERIPVGGLLVEASATHDQSTPLHLPELKGWEPSQTLKQNGFVAMEQEGRLVIWQRKAETGIGDPTVLLVAHREIAAPTVECLFELVGMGWPIALVYGDALIDRARAKAVSTWYRNERTDVFLMIDDDIVFKAEDAERLVNLAREKRSIACGAYPVGDGGHLASRGFPGQRLEFNDKMEPVEIRWAATGFMAVHRDVVKAMVEGMELCYPNKADAFWPMFTPFVLGENYLSEDYAFCERARELGFPVWLDQKAILVHLKIAPLSVWNMKGATQEAIE